MKERCVRRLNPDNLDAFTRIYLDAYPSGKNISEECYRMYFDRNLESMLEYEHVNFFGLFEGDELIAIMKLIDFEMNFFGEMKKSTGLMSMGVHPLHKRKGAARELVSFFEEYTEDTGGLVSMFLPFRVDFYRKMGYGYGTKLDEYRIPTVQLPICRDISNLRIVKKDEVSKILTCHSEFVKRYHGAVKKFGEEIRDILADDNKRYLGYFDGEEMKGYAAFDFISESDVNYTLNRIEVSELVYSNGDVLRSLIGGLRMQADLAQNIVIRTGEADFYHLLDSPQDTSGNYIKYGFLQTNVSAMGNMYKIPNIKWFIDNTKNRRFVMDNIKITVRVKDEFKNTEEEFSLIFRTSDIGNYSNWFYSEDLDDSEFEIICNLADLSSLLMGSAEFAPLVRMGIVKISDVAEIERLDRLFHYCQKPFTNTDY